MGDSDYSDMSDLPIWHGIHDFAGYQWQARVPDFSGYTTSMLTHLVSTDPQIESMGSASTSSGDYELDAGEYLYRVTKTSATVTFIRTNSLKLEPVPKRKHAKGKKTRRGHGLKKIRQGQKALVRCPAKDRTAVHMIYPELI